MNDSNTGIAIAFDVPSDLTATFKYKAGQFVTKKSSSNGRTAQGAMCCRIRNRC